MGRCECDSQGTSIMSFVPFVDFVLSISIVFPCCLHRIFAIVLVVQLARR